MSRRADSGRLASSNATSLCRAASRRDVRNAMRPLSHRPNPSTSNARPRAPVSRIRRDAPASTPLTRPTQSPESAMTASAPAGRTIQPRPSGAIVARRPAGDSIRGMFDASPSLPTEEPAWPGNGSGAGIRPSFPCGTAVKPDPSDRPRDVIDNYRRQNDMARLGIYLWYAASRTRVLLEDFSRRTGIPNSSAVVTTPPVLTTSRRRVALHVRRLASRRLTGGSPGDRTGGAPDRQNLYSSPAPRHRGSGRAPSAAGSGRRRSWRSPAWALRAARRPRPTARTRRPAKRSPGPG